MQPRGCLHDRAQPALRRTCEGQLGAAYYMLGPYQNAINAYEPAITAGEDRGMMEDNIKEAREALAKHGQTR
ncbi:MAG: hypothetical protein ABI321_16185 [Polyangia bacterium]